MEVDISKHIKICNDNGLKVYGTNKAGVLRVQVEEVIKGLPKPKITISSIRHSDQKKLNEAVAKTYRYYSNKISETIN